MRSLPRGLVTFAFTDIELQYEEALAIAGELGDERNECYCLAGLACAAALRGDTSSADRYWAQTEELERRLSRPMLAAERVRYERIMRTP